MISLGLVLAAGAALLFTVSLALQKTIMTQNPGANALEICLVVNTIKYICSEGYRVHCKQPYELSSYSRTSKLLIVANQLATVPSFILCALSLQYISIGLEMMIGNVTPFIVAILSFLVLRETTHWLELLNMIASFFCVLIVVQQRYDGEQGDFNNVIIGVAYGLASVVFFSIMYIICRYIRDVHYSVVSSLGAGVGLVFYIVAYALSIATQDYSWITLTAYDVGLSVLSGVTATGCALLFTAASQIELASRVAQLDFTEIVFGYAIDRVVFGIALTTAEVMGCVAISIGGVTLFYLAHLNDKDCRSSLTTDSQTDDLCEPLIGEP